MILIWYFKKYIVLIVAKCIVNFALDNNSSTGVDVLIVAKCIVNNGNDTEIVSKFVVLIVAKCIVNYIILHWLYYISLY